MIIELESAIQQAKSVDELKPLMRLMVKALNTLNDARSHVRGTLIFHDKGPVLRCDDGNYYLQPGKFTLVFTGPKNENIIKEFEIKARERKSRSQQ